MKALARSHFWWPKLDSEIEDLVKGCQVCQSNKHMPPTPPVHPWKWPERPWQRIHIDFAQKGKNNFLVVTDAYSRWPEVKCMANTSATATVEAVRGMFAAYGLVEELVSDNGPQLVSKEFETFLQQNGVKHIKSAPYHAASNGAAERLVQNLKQSLEKHSGSGRSLQHMVDNFLFVYRNTPHATTGKTPAELFLKRQLRTRLSLVKPSFSTEMQERQASKVNKGTGKPLRSFQVGQAVLVRDSRGGEREKWA